MSVNHFYGLEGQMTRVSTMIEQNLPMEARLGRVVEDS